MNDNNSIPKQVSSENIRDISSKRIFQDPSNHADFEIYGLHLGWSIFPIVYYEGAAKWTADLHLRDRIQKGNVFGSHIPE